MESIEVDVPASFAWRRRVQFSNRVALCVVGVCLLFVSGLDPKTRATIGGAVSFALLLTHYVTWACPRCARSFSFLAEGIRFCPHCGVRLRDEK
jgi:hypothetical protein